MIAFLYYLLKVCICSGILFLYYHFALRNKLFHQWNRFYLLFSVVQSLVLPLLQFTVLFESKDQNNAWILLQKMQSANEYLDEFVVVSHRSSPEVLFWTGYAFGCALFLFAFLFSLIKIIALIHRHSFETIDKIKVVNTDVPGTPFTFLYFIFWNKKISLQSATGQQMFRHELVHVREKHTLDKLFLRLVLSFFWFNPFFWLVRKELSFIHEFIADKKAIGGRDAASFAAMILQTAYPQQFASLVHPFFQTTIKRRLTMLTKNQRVNYASRIIALPVLVLITFAFSVRTKATETNNYITTNRLERVNKESGDTLPQKKKDIIAIDINKNNSTAKLHYSDGTTATMSEKETSKALAQQEAEKIVRISVKDKKDTLPQTSANPQPLYMLDGKEFTGDLNTIDPKRIESINVLKNKTAIDKYGDKAKNGVVEITLKKSGNSVTQESTQPIFEQTEIPASIEVQEWRAFLAKNLQPIIENAARKGAKPGRYTVNIRFLVKTDGSLSDFTALNNPGYDLDKQMLAVMPNSPRWKPAMQNGKLVNSYHTQPVTFVIQEQ